jgi:4-hydroxy-tetrahydrodipicolinate reductase
MIKVLHIGLGAIGAAAVRQVASRKGMQIVAAVDIDPAKIGRDVGAVCGIRRKLGVIVTDDIARAIKAGKPDIAVLCTESSLKALLPQIEKVLKLKVPIVSKTEELAYPVPAHRATAKKIDALARRARVTVLGTGVNPGFAMDALPIALTSLAAKVDCIEVTRVEIAPRLGTPRGLAESVAMLADAMGWKLDSIDNGVGSVKGKVRIKLQQQYEAAAVDPQTTIRISGTPPITATISGINGDIATAAMAVNSIPKVLTAQPGLRTMKDMVLPSYFGG